MRSCISVCVGVQRRSTRMMPDKWDLLSYFSRKVCEEHFKNMLSECKMRRLNYAWIII